MFKSLLLNRMTKSIAGFNKNCIHNFIIKMLTFLKLDNNY